MMAYEKHIMMAYEDHIHFDNDSAHPAIVIKEAM